MFRTNESAGVIREYDPRWEIESGYENFAFACLSYSTWRAADSLVRLELTGGYEWLPAVTANAVLTLLRIRIGVG